MVVSSTDACESVRCSTQDPAATIFCASGSTAEAVIEAERHSLMLVSALGAEAERARRWRYLWTGLNGISTVAPLAALPLVRRAIWSDLIVGSIASAASTGFTFFLPLDVEAVPDELASTSSRSSCERSLLVRKAFEAAADDEVNRRAWPWHLLNFGISASLGAVLAYGFDHPEAGLLTGLSGFAVGEAQLFSQPAGLDGVRRAERLALHPVWSFSRAPTSFVGVVFEGPLP